jgi:hypothetical protein
MRLPRLTRRRCMPVVAVLAAPLGVEINLGMVGLIPAALLVTLVVLSMPRRAGRPPMLATFGLICAVLFVPFLVSILLSKAMWGYYLSPSPVDRRILEARLVRSVSFARSQAYRNGEADFVFAPFGSVTKAITAGQLDPFQRWITRALVGLKERQRLPEDPKRAGMRSSIDLYRLVETSGWLVTGKTEFVHAKELRGVAIEAIGADGSPLVFLAVHGGEVSDGRYAFYEFLFSGPLDGSPLKLLSTQRFYFEVGGRDWLGWPEFFAIISAIELLLLACVIYAINLKRARASGSAITVDKA